MKKDFHGYSKDLLEVLFEKPYCTIQSIEDRGIVKRKTASVYLKQLHELGLLSPVKDGKKMFYVNTTLYDLLSKPIDQITLQKK